VLERLEGFKEDLDGDGVCEIALWIADNYVDHVYV